MAKAAPPGGMLVITLTRSAIGTPYRHRLVLRGLGLRKLHQTVTHRDSQQVRGMIHKVGYLLKVESR